MISEGSLIDDRLQILGPCPWWSEAARSGRLAVDGAERPVAIVLGPEVDDPDAVGRARERASAWLGLREPGVLPLLEVLGAEGRVAWVYEACDGVSASALLAVGEGAHLRVGTEIVAACAEVLERQHGSGRSHPGLAGDDVIVDPDGAVLVAGFVGPFAQAPVHRDPRGVDDAASTVWRLGVLLAELLTGAPPMPAADAAGHELMVRRLLVRIMSRPGPMLPDRFGDWLRGMLAWDVDQRPLLPRIGPALRELAGLLPPPDLVALGARVPELRVNPAPLLGAPGSATDPAIARWLQADLRPDTPSPTERTVERTEEASWGDLNDADDVTALSADGDPPSRVPPPPEHGAIPVQVGPPPEAVPKPRSRRLPQELFDRPEAREPTDSGERRRWQQAGGAAAVLLLVAVGLVWYLWS
jgi:hypothetical protein